MKGMPRAEQSRSSAAIGVIRMAYAKLIGMMLRIDNAGRIVVPKPIRDRLGLRPGTELDVAEGPDGLLIRRTERQPRLMKQGHLLVHTGKLPAGHNVLQAVEADREDRVREIWSR